MAGSVKALARRVNIQWNRREGRPESVTLGIKANLGLDGEKKVFAMLPKQYGKTVAWERVELKHQATVKEHDDNLADAGEPFIYHRRADPRVVGKVPAGDVYGVTLPDYRTIDIQALERHGVPFGIEAEIKSPQGSRWETLWFQESGDNKKAKIDGND
jgi:hypothetical protein